METDGKSTGFLMKFLVGVSVPLVPLSLGLLAASFSFGCGLGGGSNFDCRIIAPTILFSFVAALAAAATISAAVIRKQNSTQAKRILFTSFLVPAFLLTTYSVPSQDFRLKYFEGMTPQACATGKPIVPWGKYIHPDSCYLTFGMCEKVQDAYSEAGCFEKNREFTTYEDCAIFKNYNNKLACEVTIAQKSRDYAFCAQIVTPRFLAQSAIQPVEESYKYVARHDCLLKVSGAESSIVSVISSNYYNFQAYMKADYCALYANQVQKDVCYAHNARQHDLPSMCENISNQLPWLKDNCKIVSEK